ncbi:AraC family transcriptional regulator [Chryseobacterium indologenes]|uniref:AraC family transcriptional regulator n=1 Tax=Chryseobacterium indologenes TaxID=253 RepID=UPI000BFE4CF7|nr:helix-turn-helix domain-containing protein [Chryseobacterium indologenes]ATN05734.1 AraC family transcriptional regulator [Chryseobacterium indologenes]AYY85508.1 helix-turn-helix domain-containing protein [Chryseobacterium indologenes]QIX82406.1 helix-turn-helix domain-containing protein [Chryseobacterium indologenes]TLX26495.1 helix-turn-helix domain-containing protein [Chryseobacterium indologenes]UDQ52048.1 helix-turn-helix domain-containing protein [Chryseobacterium indologenes]
MEAKIQSYHPSDFPSELTSENYTVVVWKGSGVFSVDDINYAYKGCHILFISPYQKLKFLAQSGEHISVLLFHGDYYCIEYHKEEVACNGLLFNNIYLDPAIELAEENYRYILELFNHIRKEESEKHQFSESIIKTYIQLILAICSKQKSGFESSASGHEKIPNKKAMEFQKLLEMYYKKEKELSFYSDRLNITNNTLSKIVKKEFAKTPTQLINERIILESKKLLHLTYRSVKEIASELGFEDEFYFSRYFKKSVSCSPKNYREKVGISVVAKMSM